jgi:hypothetical protein
MPSGYLSRASKAIGVCCDSFRRFAFSWAATAAAVRGLVGVLATGTALTLERSTVGRLGAALLGAGSVEALLFRAAGGTGGAMVAGPGMWSRKGPGVVQQYPTIHQTTSKRNKALEVFQHPK